MGYTLKFDTVLANHADERQNSARGNFCAGKTELCTIALEQKPLNDHMLKKLSLLLYKRRTRRQKSDLMTEV
jgi:hypothetical protein